MRKKLAELIVLTFAVSTSFMGCAKDVSGTYTALTTYEAVSSEDQRAELTNEGYEFLLDTEVELNLELNADGSYKLALNPEITEASVNELMDVNQDIRYEKYTGGDPESFAKFCNLASAADVKEQFEISYAESTSNIIDAFTTQLQNLESAGSYSVNSKDITITPNADRTSSFSTGTIEDKSTVSLALEKLDNSVSTIRFSK